MPPFTLAAAILAFIAIDFIVVGAVMGSVVGMTWNSLADRFPARDPSPDAIGRNFQTVAIGIANFGMCAHIAADEGSLHLRPALFLRLFHARGFSVPWDKVAFKRKRRVFGTTYVEVRIGSTTLTGPEWCLGLTESPTDNR